MTTSTSMARPAPFRIRRLVGGSALTALTWLVTFVFFFPVAWMVFTGLKTEADAAASPPRIFVELSFDRFGEVLQRGFSGYFINSMTASVLSIVLVMALAIPAAYSLAIRPTAKARDVLFFFISTRFLPAAAGVIPVYLILKQVGALDNITVLAILYIGINLPLAIWMLRSFFSEVPIEIIEASRVDGANTRTELLRIALPLVAPGAAAVALISFIFAWNEYFLVNLLTAAAARTTPPFLGSLVDGRGQFVAVLCAASTLAVLPVVIAGWLAQKRLVRGLAMGAVK